jgi:hypothetical protein
MLHNAVTILCNDVIVLVIRREILADKFDADEDDDNDDDVDDNDGDGGDVRGAYGQSSCGHISRSASRDFR